MTSALSHLSDAAARIHREISPVDAAGADASRGAVASRLDELVEMLQRGPSFAPEDLPAYIDAVRNLSGETDDRKFLLEHLVKFMSRLPEGSELAIKMERYLIDVLYKDLPHPPSGYLSSPSAYTQVKPPAAEDRPSQRLRYAFRSEDGSGYNPLFPAMGMAGQPYARSVPGLQFAPARSLPDPGLVFDTLLRRDAFVRHPGGISSMFFAMANLIIHSIFDTDHTDETINGTSSYLDLSPLYGGSTGVQSKPVKEMRVFDGTGAIHPDTFADARLLIMPPSTPALLVLFNRNHNYIARKILDINEKGTFNKDVDALSEEQRKAQDDEIFQRARLVNCGFFMQIILRDYVGAILGLGRDGLSFRLDPLEAFRDTSHSFSPRGEGNMVSIEFNLLYRWHATISQDDAQWTEEMFKRFFRTDKPEDITVDDFRKAATSAMARKDTPVTSPKWTFGGLQRQADGTFADADLARILHGATLAPASAFKAKGIPAYMRVIEVLGIEQGRKWGACSLNEFRSFMGLKPYKSFKEWNSRAEVWKAAETLYTHIDNLELHVGLQAEEAKPLMPGAGLCPGYTISRAILGDAVALVRGDPYLTVDFTPFNLTSWGYQDCLADTQDGAYGGILTKLLFRTLPDHYPSGSVLAHFPFLVPEPQKEAMEKRHDPHVNEYDWLTPQPRPPVVTISSYTDVLQVFARQDDFGLVGKGISELTDGVAVDRALADRTLLSPKWTKELSKKMEAICYGLIDDKSVEHVGSTAKFLDIAQLMNVLPVHLIANHIVGLPLKSEDNPRGDWRDAEYYQKFADLANYVFMDFDNQAHWKLRLLSKECLDVAMRPLQRHLASLSAGRFSIAGLADNVISYVTAANDYSGAFLTDLLHSAKGASSDEIIYSLLAATIATAPLFSSALTHVVEFYLDESRQEVKNRIVALVNLPKQTEEIETELLGYIREALRVNPAFSAIYLTAKKDTTLHETPIAANQRVLASIKLANLDSSIFGYDLNFSRPPTRAGIYTLGGRGFLNADFFDKAAPRVLRAVFRLRALQKAPGDSGAINRFTQDLRGVPLTSFIDTRGKISPFPASLGLQYSM